MDQTQKPTVASGDQGTAVRRRLWDQFMRTLDPHQRRDFYRLLAPYPRKRFERALVRLVLTFDKADQLLAESQSARQISDVHVATVARSFLLVPIFATGGFTDHETSGNRD